MSRLTVVVIGAGVIGMSLGWSLLEDGAEVTVVASTNPHEEIGWATVAWSNASSKVRRGYPDHYTALNARGVSAVRDLANEIGGSWLQTTGTIEIVSGPDAGAELAADVDRLNQIFDYQSELLTRNRIAELAPGIAVHDGDTAAFYLRDALVDPTALVSDLAGAFSRAEGRLLRDRVVGFKRSATAIQTVCLESGASLTADVVAFAAGAWTRDVAALAGIDVAMLPRGDHRVAGLIAAISCADSALGPMVLSPDVLVRPCGSGRALVGSDHDDPPVTPASTRAELLAAAETWRQRAAVRIPALERSEVLDVRLGMRALTPDGLTIAGVPANAENAYVLTTHSGFTLAPVLGRLAAAEISRDVTAGELEPYRPDRFETARSS